MPNISINTSFNTVVGTSNVTVGGNLSYVTTGSGYFSEEANVYSGSWTLLPFGAFTNVAGFTVINDGNVNNNTASLIAVATGSNGSGVLGYLPPNGALVIPWSGSFNNNVGVYASVVAGWPSGTSNPVTASVKWQGQQS